MIRGHDPNAKIGPGGFGPQGYIDPAESFAYRIDFENEATATAPAQRVDVSDQLDPDLDWSTLEFTSFGFGDTFVAIPPGSQYYHTTVSMVQNDQEFLVEVELGLYLDSGEIYASFQSLDPGTNLPPDVLTGFLPPEDGAGRGQGHVAYAIRPSTTVTTGTEIRNVALIRFDFAEVIATNQVDPHDPNQGTDPALEALNTVDATPPTSAVNALPATSPSVFVVSWSGADGAGSGVAAYDIYVSDNGGPYTAWQTAITTTMASFAGAGGHTYAFYSVATDNVGHRETTPSAAQATTAITVMPAPPTVSISMDGAALALTWAGDPGFSSYEVCWSTMNPYFSAGDSGVTCQAAPGAGFTVSPAPPITTFYLVRGVTGAGSHSADSNRVGVFRFPITPGS